MSQELKSKTEESKFGGVSLTRFSGGLPTGACIVLVQRARDITPSPVDHIFQQIRLTRSEAALLAADLLDFAQGKEIEEYNN